VTATATSEDLWVAASGRLAIQSAARRYRLRGVTARFIARGQTARLELRLPANALGAARRALRSHREVRAQLRLSARDAAGNVTARKRAIKLER
jgi:hypothetical protein